MTRRWAFATIGLAAGFSGMAVLVSILSGVALSIAEAAFVVVPLIAVIIVAHRAAREVTELDGWSVVS